MGLRQPPSPPHLYPQALQLKLYQAFIFSIPILFSIILFLLFYLFYLKRRASNLSSPPTLPLRLNQATSFLPSPFEVGLKGELKDQLQIVIFDEDLRAKDSQCCVCLGEFEIKEELQQIPSCKHVFHMDCIHHWLRANSTCPLCRCSLVPTRKLDDPDPPVRFNLIRQTDANSGHHPELGTSEQEVVGLSVNLSNFSSEEQPRQAEGSSRGRSCLTRLVDSRESSVRRDDTMDDGTSIVVQIQIHNS
ncbi:hypothetical protein HHK36_000060 [Tetracentron sinense]|uniref:RING-type E3 ubiquitin transferase n=1 Tax=Tetracentron sinense TaxID=13715 RepID=A0A834ZVA3_TETSI|nr:hypothetical protein HHK36_000060 [Tetracentron sinense]